MNNYIEVPIEHNKISTVMTGRFHDSVQEKLHDIQAGCIIDTGCQLTAIPFRYIVKGYDDDYYKECKSKAINAFRNRKLTALLSRGVESSHSEEKVILEALSDDELMALKQLSFKFKVSELYIGNYKIGNVEVKVNYDRDHEPLIGMNILKRLQYNVGRNSIIHSDVFIACLKGNLTPEYFDALEQHLGLVPKEKALVEKNKYIEEYKVNLLDEAMEKALEIARKEVATASTSDKNEKHKDIAASFRDFYDNIFPNMKDNK